ncbi:TPA: hypothetical protein ACSQFI_003579 [Pseudomonas aeruginosa]|uniref:hypothetical protein n=1 Tax=Pseudomonas aeruginosa TaxID=287 RepID=UPI001C3ED9D4|nr:hypothetical protein [Pseudomonas aeruginosa]EKU5532973.1 hypothetical protein [Pseudomonas aeruginosa]EKW5992871.1 hypothetical protein [Pseudomonas aeruginosa]EMB6065635.1 hypothetical protein [Pseudomonas aeruginosa]MBV5767826.1 hypothetical protein [Pseudomonas aeruginosa]MBV5995653.1 hypothetical protein [Pseudomonas aeruginosa]
MNDRELLELAARAAGIDPVLAEPINLSTGVEYYWNPRDDDGDALRLAVKLRLDITFYNGFQEVAAEPSNGDGMNPSQEVFIEDPYAATRRAITRAAAEIGKSMGGGE